MRVVRNDGNTLWVSNVSRVKVDGKTILLVRLSTENRWRVFRLLGK